MNLRFCIYIHTKTIEGYWFITTKDKNLMFMTINIDNDLSDDVFTLQFTRNKLDLVLCWHCTDG